MFKKLTPLFLIIVTAGVFVSCSSSNPMLGEAESSIQAGNYEAAMASADKFIKQNPDSPLGYYWKGVAYGQQAQDQATPEAAASLYEQMNQNFAKARELGNNMEEAPGELDRIQSFKTSLWRSEHNTAVQYANDDSLRQTTQNPMGVALAHLNNATTIQPDSARSWLASAQINSVQGNFAEAITAQEKYIDLADNLEAKDYLLLAQYYRKEDQTEKALTILEETREKYPDNDQVLEILSDSYTTAGESEKAIALVEGLVEKNPDNPQYRLSLGTRIFQNSIELQETYDENIDEIFNLRQKARNASGSEVEDIQSQVDDLRSENEQLRQEINSLTDRAIDHINRALKNGADKASAYNTLGYVYQNKASLIFAQRGLITDQQQSSELNAKGQELLKQAMTNYEQAAEINPDNPEIWRSLFQVYTALGMDQKAEEAEKKAGMQ